MKTGIEVEGRYKGLRTLFIGAAEYSRLIETGRLQSLMVDHPHLYISDLDNTLDYDSLVPDCLEGKVITLEVTRVPPGLRPGNLSIMLRLPHLDEILQLSETDMFKFTRETDRTVKVGLPGMLIHTDPSDFEGDEDLE